MRRSGAICLSILLLFSCIGSVFGSEPQPKGCPPKMVCMTVKEAATMRKKQAAADLELDELKYENRKLSFLVKKPSKIFLDVGLEYLPNLTDKYQPYAIGGVRFGRISLWGGTFGDEPALGVGWSF